jgi:hypothetical protein
MDLDETQCFDVLYYHGFMATDRCIAASLYRRVKPELKSNYITYRGVV